MGHCKSLRLVKRKTLRQPKGFINRPAEQVDKPEPRQLGIPDAC